MALPTPLSPDAEQHRNDLARWIKHTEPEKDYVFDEKGNRIYSKQNMTPYVKPLLKAMGLSNWGFTMWRYSAYTPINPVPRTELYFIPINIISGQPQLIQNGRQSQVVPGWYTVTTGAFELTPEFDCLFVGDISKAREI